MKNMASIIKKKIRGQVYYYAVESKRVNGKPRIVWQKYLGKVTDIVRAVDAGSKPGPRLARIYSFGVEAALLGIARRLGVEEIINKYAGREGAVPGAGEYILIYTINACAGPGTKLSRWYERTVLRRHFKISPKMLTEKRFWSEAESLSEEALEKIQYELAGRIFSEFGVGTRVLLYRDLKPGHIRCRGLKTAYPVPGIELLVSSDFMVPLFYNIYPSGFPDEAAVRQCTDGLAAKYRRLIQSEPDITVVKHRRCHYGEARMPAAGFPHHILGTLAAGENEDLLDIPLERFHHLNDSRQDKVKVYRCSKVISGRDLPVLVVFSEKEKAVQLEAVRSGLGECLRELDFGINHAAFDMLREKNLGKSIIFTDNINWSNEEIYRAFAGRSELEELLGPVKKEFSVLSCLPEKKDLHLKIHIFCVVLGLILQTLLRRELHRYGIEGNVPGILKILANIREVAVVYAGEEHRRRRREYLTLTEMDPVQKEIYECLSLSQFEAGGGSRDT